MLHLSLPLDHGGPGVVNFERAGICTPILEISSKRSKLKVRIDSKEHQSSE